MILNAPLSSTHSILPSLSFDYSLELSYATWNSWSTPNTSPSPSLSKSNSPKSTVSQVRERRTFNLPCSVCGAEATGYHYNVASCNGCKTFFRRCVLSGSSYRCIRGDSNCLSNMQGAKGARIKCRSCRLDRCLQEGMRKEAVTSGLITNEERSAPQNAYLAAISQPSTSTAIPKVTETASCLRQTLRLISRFRRCDVSLKGTHLSVGSLLNTYSFLDNLSDYEELTDFHRELPDWCTLDLVCAIEFSRRLPDLSKFKDCDKEELIRSSAFTLAIAIQAIESYFQKQKTVFMPDGTDVMKKLIERGMVDSYYTQMFVSILDPLHRESFTIDELALTLQLLFFTMATSEFLTPEGKMQLESSIKSSMQCLMVLLITQNMSSFSARYGSLIALNETFITTAFLHKKKIHEGTVRFDEILKQQCIFNIRSST